NYILTHLPLSVLLLSITGTPPTELYTLSLHDALPIYRGAEQGNNFQLRLHAVDPEKWDLIRSFATVDGQIASVHAEAERNGVKLDRKSTRLNSSHLVISYAVFCLKKKTGAVPVYRRQP